MRRKSSFWIAIIGAALAISLAASAATIPPGTSLTVRTTSALSSATARAGDSFDGALVNDVVVGNQTVAKAGDAVRGQIVQVKASGRLKDPGTIAMRLTSVAGNSISTNVFAAKGKGHTKGNATKIGGGAALGAIIGGLAGGGKGAAIGAGAGAAAGTGVAVATGKKDVVIPAETVMTFTVTSSSGSNSVYRRHR